MATWRRRVEASLLSRQAAKIRRWHRDEVSLRVD
jgi:hypothetical protein